MLEQVDHRDKHFTIEDDIDEEQCDQPAEVCSHRSSLVRSKHLRPSNQRI